MTTEDTMRKNLAASRRRVKKLEKILDEVLDSCGEPDWCYENDQGVTHGTVSLKTWVKWHEDSGRHLDETTCEVLAKR